MGLYIRLTDSRSEESQGVKLIDIVNNHWVQRGPRGTFEHTISLYIPSELCKAVEPL